MTDAAADARLAEVEDITRQVGKLLYGKGPDVQSAILGNLVAMWLAGLHAPDDDAATLDIRVAFLAEFVALVRDLVPINAQALGVPAPVMPEDDAARLRKAASEENDEICQLLGAALGYPRFCDDQANFPGAVEADGVCVGEHVAVTLAQEAADRLALVQEWTAEMEAACVRLARRLVNVGRGGVRSEAEQALAVLADIVTRIQGRTT